MDRIFRIPPFFRSLFGWTLIRLLFLVIITLLVFPTWSEGWSVGWTFERVVALIWQAAAVALFVVGVIRVIRHARQGPYEK